VDAFGQVGRREHSGGVQVVLASSTILLRSTEIKSIAHGEHLSVKKIYRFNSGNI